MENDIYYTIQAPAEAMLKEKGSRFLAFAYPIDNEELIKEQLQQLRKKYFDASHHCYAYIWGEKSENYRANDDGEPANSAGMPILGQIRSRNLSNVLVVVVRYFGGTKLGVGGLIQAYKSAAAQALDNALIIEQFSQASFTIRFEYAQMNWVMKVLKDTEAQIMEQTMDLACQIKFSVRKAKSPIIADKLQNFLQP
ncbi:MAG: IMPACT family protein [Microscillaceae bacterium]|jgi:uncharacterized YigZ family protein|nr:IMPACT family protein [Microscillaceae bacterium]